MKLLTRIIVSFYFMSLVVLISTGTTIAGPLEDLLLVQKYQNEMTAGNLKSAERLANKLTDPNMVNLTASALYQGYMEKNDLKSAERVANKLTDPNMKSIVTIGLVTKAIELKKCAMAQPLIEKLTDKNIQTMLRMSYAISCK
jgi:hypothetical protein